MNRSRMSAIVALFALAFAAEGCLARACDRTSDWTNTGSPGCGQCVVANCRAQAMGAPPGCDAELQCANGCSGSQRCECLSNCVTSPNCRSAVTALLSCIQSNCESACR